MDQDDLKRLQEKYGGSGADKVFNPEFRRQIAALFRRSGGRTPAAPYSGLPTLLDAPAGELSDKVDIALVGVPLDLGVTNRPGARFGPRALRAIERVGPYNHALKVSPGGALRMADVGDVPFRGQFDPVSCMEDIELFFDRVREAGARPVSAGGDHSVTFPILKALGRDRPLGMIHIDAHCDTGGPLGDTKFHHGGPFRHAVLAGVLDPKRTIQIGIRGAAELLWEFSYDAGMTVLHIEDVVQLGLPAVVDRARAVVGDGPVYVSFDVDSLDPAFAPGTGTPEVGGLSPREAQAILRGLAGLDVVGGDVVEVAPQYDANDSTALVGAQMMFEIASLIALGPHVGGRRR